jgi:hypothetical protein
MGGEILWGVRPKRELSPMDVLIVRLSPSSIRMKRKGERGSPCFIPLEGEKGFEGTPLMRMENKVEEVRLKIQETQMGSKTKARRVDLK